MVEEACRAQLDAKDQAYDQLALSLQSKNRELELANQKVGCGVVMVMSGVWCGDGGV